MCQQGGVAGAAVGGRGIGNVVKESAENTGRLVQRRRSAHYTAPSVVTVGLLLTDDAGVISESIANAITKVGTGGGLDCAFKVGPVIHQVPGHGANVLGLRAGAALGFKRN